MDAQYVGAAGVPRQRIGAAGTDGRTEEAEAEAGRAYRTERGRRWYRHNPHGADAIAAATKAGGTARERTAQHLLAARLEQLSGQAATRTETATAVRGRAGCLLDGDVTGAVIV
ncbi:hypothetical protein [Streptomyces sp. NPDC020965]|uniref:hypothetical protein n=1 Tax=Streptomyces sp. NPDC020965 TaxID=3365105 RepID=UPI0037880615